MRDYRQLVNEARLTQLLYDAVCEYSPSYAEQPSVFVFESAIMDADLRLETQIVDTPGAEPDEPRRNLIIRLGPEPVELLWLGHTDTVILPDDEVLEPRIEQGILHGLGSADMKSGCAAAIEAAIILQEAGVELERGIAIGLVVGEEEYGDGAERLLERVRAPLAVVGEPTGLTPCLEHFGYFEAELRTKGRRAHAAVPEFGANAIHAMLAWLTQVLEASATRTDTLVINPRDVRGSSPLFAVPEGCTSTIDAHIPGVADISEVREILNEALTRAQAQHPDCEFEWEEIFYAQGYSLDPEEPALRPLLRATGERWKQGESVAFRSHSDAALLAEHGFKPIVMGPGQLGVAHTPEEHVRLDEVMDAAACYASIFEAVGAPGR
jgi:acetylornithine deacetylase